MPTRRGRSLDWEHLVRTATERWETPFFISAWPPVLDALGDLSGLSLPIPVRHWLSIKTHPVSPLLRAWRESGLGVEVVSQYELMAALKAGFHPSNIIVNGVSKHRWLSGVRNEGLIVHFDSLEEVSQLSVQAEHLNWRVGLRLHVSEEHDPDETHFGGQFGLTLDEAAEATTILGSQGVRINSIHFHLRTNVTEPSSYVSALEETAQFCHRFDLRPSVFDCGGGFPARHCANLQIFGGIEEYLSQIRSGFTRVLSTMPSVKEIWFENGRFVTGESAVLVVQVKDIKLRAECRYLICDGGRTNHAFVSDWEHHSIFTLPSRSGPTTYTTICGPTCMAYDRLARLVLPEDVNIGDYVVWAEAGAYHLPWETTFSHGRASLLWSYDGVSLHQARPPESFEQWWGLWV
jgi:diaminopimelate decarboxylase